MTRRFRLALVPLFVALCLLLGGASAEGYWANMILQLLGIVIIVWSLAAKQQSQVSTHGRQLLGLAVALSLYIALQLLPLPGALWTGLPGRIDYAASYAVLGMPLPSMPLSMAPYLTVASGLWLLPAAAALLGILKLGAYRASWFAWSLVVVTAAAVALGALQTTAAPNTSSPWYLYNRTNYGVATGFFSNGNHMATLLVIVIPFVTALYMDARRKSTSAQKASGLFVILAGALTVVLVGLAINRSLAGLGLAVPVAAASYLMSRPQERPLPKWVLIGLGVLAVAAVGSIFSQPFGNNLTTEEARSSSVSRYTSFSNSLDAAGDFFPFGSGIGTFAEIYPSYEDPQQVTRTWVNHVHSDYIEIILETGAAGLVLILLFLLWWFRRVFRVWAADERDYFACAATIATGAVLAHSAVDYPLRTAAISALFAACCALMAEPRPWAPPSRRRRKESEVRHLSA